LTEIFRRPEVLDHWFVCFSKDTVSPIWKRVCPGTYKHVSIMRYSAPADTWIYIDLNFAGVDVLVGPGDTEVIEIISKTMGEVDVLKFPIKRPSPVIIRPLFNCVAFVKHVLGVKAPFVLTPDQLFHYLLSRDAELFTP